MTELTKEYPERSTQAAGFPVDITKEEFIRFNMSIARSFGALRMQIPMLVCFVIYMAIIAFLAVSEWTELGHLTPSMILMSVVALASAVPMMILMPRKVKRSAIQTYDANNDNGYYGEIRIQNGEIVKDVGYKQVKIPLNEQTIYIENTEYMAFSTANGMATAIVLPARCMTADMAAAVRQEVFSPANRLQRRVIRRMVALATVPMAYREPMAAPATLYELNFTYQPEELGTMMADASRRQYVRNLPTLLLLSALLGAVVSMMYSTIWALVMTVPALLLLSLLASALNASAAARRAKAMPTVRVSLLLTERGLEYEMMPPGRGVSVNWQGICRATESDSFVEFTLTSEQMLRVPKRCVDDMDTLKHIVDTRRKP